MEDNSLQIMTKVKIHSICALWKS